MAGGMREDATESNPSAPRQLTRRDFTRLSAVAGGVVWAAPQVSTIRFAQQIVGSVPKTTTPPTDPPPTTGPTTSTPLTTAPPTTTPPTTSPPTTGPGTTLPGSTTSSSVGPTGTTLPNSTTTSPGGNTTTTVCKPGEGFGDPNHCHSGAPGQQGSTVPGATIGGGSTGSGSGSGSGSGTGNGIGVLSFTGADSIDLAILGATAVVVGRALYAFGRRPREEEVDLAAPGLASPID
jgi:hypothetical protein